eukprot:327969_1
MAFDTTWGLIFAIISMICNGSFSSLNKLNKVQASNINPQIFNLYFIFGVILSSITVYIILVFIGETVEFTYLGVISGFCLAICGFTTFAAIKYIGLSIGVTIWSGTAILISFVQGFIAGTTAHNLWIAIIGCILLIIGIIGVGFSDKLIQMFYINNTSNDTQTDKLLVNAAMMASPESVIGASFSEEQHSKQLQHNGYNINSNSHTNVIFGAIFAVITGIFGGSIGFPSNWTNDNNSKLKYLISFAVGCCCIIPITFIWVFCFSSNKIKWHFNTCLIPGLLAGLIWNIANVASLYAIESLSYGVAYPIMQSSLIVANLWGIFVWKEVTDKNVIILLFVFCFIVMTGCGLITIGVIGI